MGWGPRVSPDHPTSEVEIASSREEGSESDFLTMSDLVDKVSVPSLVTSDWG